MRALCCWVIKGIMEADWSICLSTRILRDDIFPKGMKVWGVFETLTSRTSAGQVSSVLTLIFLPGFPFLPTLSQWLFSIFEKEKLTMVYCLQLSEPTSRHQAKGQFKVVNLGLRKWITLVTKKNPLANQVFLMFCFQQYWRTTNWIDGI